MARALAIKSRDICTRAADFLEEQPEETMNDSEGEREMDTSITPFGEGTSFVVDSFTFLQTPDDASFELVPSPFLLKEQKETVRIVLHKIFHTLISGNITQLAYCRHATNNIFSMDWAPLYDMEQRLVDLRAQVKIRRQELDILVIAQDETLTALTTLRGSIERTRSMLADLEWQYVFQQQKLDEQLLRMQAC
ncbi:hypothetical protein MRB53_036230 [Persea americana]|uniref:Uncharacterized protein n=1 Tax=Persea americana TaxID=3435 RepID=A0ACC2K7D6_PERAE|nr:hypothetical protein MRB53_036230 [Persea americana]